MTKLAIIALLGLFLPALAYVPKIVGIKSAIGGQFPYQVALKINGTFYCGGSIVSRNFVLTAAHCVADDYMKEYPASFFTVIAGTIDYENGGISKTVKKIHIHENYGLFWNDVALIELNDAFTFSDTIQPVALDASEPPIGASVIISGWGCLSTKGSLPNELQYSNLSVAPSSACDSSIINYDGFVCLTHSSDSGACHGNSGGPATYNGKIIGIANFVFGDCGSSHTDGYASISYFYDWIIAKIN